ncbi:MAG TPA: amidohydrolase family protein, partial [Polyangiaceae bacterium]|nr:amidohydrolase family protein [Polyangiaceae bacterium]
MLVDAATQLVERVLPPVDEAAREQAIERAQALALSKGLTEVHEMGADAETVATFRRLEREGRLKLRVVAYASGGTEAARASLFARRPDPPRPGAMFRLGGIKIYADGALGSRGAALLTPYADEPEHRGLVLTDPSALEDAARRALASGWQLAVHAIGDRANRAVLDAFERAGCRRGRDVRFRVEHAQILDVADVPRFAALGVLASMQPTHATSDMPWAPTRLGPRRLAGAYAWRSLLASGARLPAGSDAPVEAIDPTFGLYAFVTRQDREGRPPGGWLPSERLRLDEAARSFGEEAAFAAFEENWRGRAAEGMAADVTVFDRRLDEADPASIRDARVVLTVVGGKIVFEPLPFLARHARRRGPNRPACAERGEGQEGREREQGAGAARGQQQAPEGGAGGHAGRPAGAVRGEALGAARLRQGALQRRGELRAERGEHEAGAGEREGEGGRARGAGGEREQAGPRRRERERSPPRARLAPGARPGRRQHGPARARPGEQRGQHAPEGGRGAELLEPR